MYNQETSPRTRPVSINGRMVLTFGHTANMFTSEKAHHCKTSKWRKPKMCVNREKLGCDNLVLSGGPIWGGEPSIQINKCVQLHPKLNMSQSVHACKQSRSDMHLSYTRIVTHEQDKWQSKCCSITEKLWGKKKKKFLLNRVVIRNVFTTLLNTYSCTSKCFLGGEAGEEMLTLEGPANLITNATSKVR